MVNEKKQEVTTKQASKEAKSLGYVEYEVRDKHGNLKYTKRAEITKIRGI